MSKVRKQKRKTPALNTSVKTPSSKKKVAAKQRQKKTPITKSSIGKVKNKAAFSKTKKPLPKQPTHKKKKSPKIPKRVIELRKERGLVYHRVRRLQGRMMGAEKGDLGKIKRELGSASKQLKEVRHTLAVIRFRKTKAAKEIVKDRNRIYREKSTLTKQLKKAKPKEKKKIKKSLAELNKKIKRDNNRLNLKGRKPQEKKKKKKEDAAGGEGEKGKGETKLKNDWFVHTPVFNDEIVKKMILYEDKSGFKTIAAEFNGVIKKTDIENIDAMVFEFLDEYFEKAKQVRLGSPHVLFYLKTSTIRKVQILLFDQTETIGVTMNLTKYWDNYFSDLKTINP